ncbi:sporulation inhibitor of replication protein SirA [Camelliibacillus cellulosilyticus]|uniref:Sporulation inhibitor of replication protein SirA n=1 Tax=Camelliibacillus cellulosilyticus TaxID=2174486 RepID=A0ABV9GJU8_9BACL
MRHYYIYLLKNEVTRSHVGKEDLLYRLFCEADREIDPKRKKILDKQVAFITQDIPIDEILQALKAQKGIQFINQHDVIISGESKGWARLCLYRKKLIMEASGSYAPEVTVFEVLRSLRAGYLAVDFQSSRGAWLKPIKSVSYI